MKNQDGRVQWELAVQVKHHAGFHRTIECSILTPGRSWIELGRVGWTGIGIPADVFQSLDAMILGIVHDQLVYRYGVQGTFPLDG